ncbi:IPT/TIG domain-containing protein [Amycolatopsis sp. lyj-346]|uniref:IPT/TIG domain-containing protein n=1 Tax=Amycolatopsis sp. lyj-346 TaxID=2789289 RepID=UPI00397BB657
MTHFEMGLHLVPTQTATPSSPSSSTPPGPLIDVSPNAAVALVAVFVVVLLVAAFIPMVVDLHRATKWRKDLTEWLKTGQHRGADLLPILRLIARPRGTVNTARPTIAYLVVALVAAAFGVTAFSSAADAPDLRKTIVASMLTVLSLVIGFYFGSRTAQTAIEAQGASANGASGPLAPVVTGVTPGKGPRASAVTVTGSGLSRASIHFGTLPATPIGPPSDWQIVVAVPIRPDGYPEEVDVVAKTEAGSSAITDATKFTFE